MKISSLSSFDKENRILYVDIAKAIAIMLVLIGHTVDSDTICKTVLYSFHMPLFFLLSGLVTRPRENYTKTTWKNFIIKRMKSILFPYFLWGCIYAKFSFKNLIYILYGTRNTLISADSLTSLWFLPVLFLASVMAEASNMAAVRLKHKNFFLTAAAAGFLCLGLFLPTNEKYGYPFGADIAFTATGFIILGEVIAKLFQKPFMQRISSLIVCFLCCISGMTAYFLIIPQNGYVLMANSIYGNKLEFLYTSLIGSLLVISFSILLEMFSKKQKLLPYIGRNTLGIFILHKPFVELLRKVINKIGFDYNQPVWYLLIMVITLCIVLVILWIMHFYFPFLFGKFQERSPKK